jgi:lysophospholipase L1-like esterase
LYVEWKQFAGSAVNRRNQTFQISHVSAAIDMLHFLEMFLKTRLLAGLLALFPVRCALAQSTEVPADVFASLNIACWGDSLTAGSGGTPYPAQLAALLGAANVYNGGVSGDTSATTAQRMTAASSMAGYFTIIWVGRNNVYSGTVLNDIATMVASLSTPRHFVVMSILNSSAEPKGNPVYNAILSLNQQIAATYPNNYLDIRSFLVSQYNPSSAQDLTDYNNDVVPTSIRADSLHLNTTGYGIIAKRLQAYYAAVFGQYTVNGSLLPYIFGSPGPIGSNAAQAGTFSAVNTTGTINLPATTSTAGQLVQNGNVLMHTWGGSNMFIGTGSQMAGNFTTTGSQNVGLGAADLNFLTSGSNNLAIGSYALLSATSADSNVGIGAQALSNLLDGSLNIGIGRQAGIAAVSGYRDTFIGAGADGKADVSASIAIGSQAKVGCSYCAVIGGTGTNSVKTGIGVDTPAYPLDVAGTIHSQQAIFDDGLTVNGVRIVPAISAQTAPIGGAIAAGACLTQMAPVPSATSSMVAYVSPAGDPGPGISWSAFASAGTVTVRVCSSGAPVNAIAVPYNLRVIP